MKVVLFCGGFGTRLREFSEVIPKPMVNIGNRPIMWHLMKYYAHYGHKEFILCLGYKGHLIKEYFLNFQVLNHDFTVVPGLDGSAEVHDATDELSWRVTLVDTGHDAMTGARIKRVAPYIDTDQFMVTYGDGVADVDIGALVSFHLSHQRIATVTGVRREQGSLLH